MLVPWLMASPSSLDAGSSAPPSTLRAPPRTSGADEVLLLVSGRSPSRRRPSAEVPRVPLYGETPRCKPSPRGFQGARSRGKPIPEDRIGRSSPSPSPGCAVPAAAPPPPPPPRWESVRSMLRFVIWPSSSGGGRSSGMNESPPAPSPSSAVADNVPQNSPSEAGVSPLTPAGGKDLATATPGLGTDAGMRLALSRLFARRRKLGHAELSFSLVRLLPPPEASAASSAGSREPSRLRKGSPWLLARLALPPTIHGGKKLLALAPPLSEASAASADSAAAPRSGEAYIGDRSSCCSSRNGIIVGGVRGRRFGLLGPVPLRNSSCDFFRLNDKLKRLMLRL
mmetsp:Transcript_98906/g.284175  ORF Transcript_98906/g.284175 Transcript_98906/m.284175 type:complete len:339 (-) Transcript_98906:379-1395(-)